MSSVASDIFIEDNVSNMERNVEEEQQESCCEHEGDRLLPVSLHEVVNDLPSHLPPHPPPDPQQRYDHLSSPLLDHISSPISAQLFDFCDPDIFNDALQNSEVTSSPNGCIYENQNSSFATNLAFPPNIIEYQNNNNGNKFITEALDISNFQGDQNDLTTTASTPTASQHHHHGGANFLFESQDDIDNDISASIDFSPSPSFSAIAPYNFNNLTTTPPQDHLQHYQLPLGDHHHHVNLANNDGFSQYPTTTIDHNALLPLLAGHHPHHGPLGTVFEDDCLSPIPPFLRFNPSTVSATATATTSSSSSCTSFLDRSIGSFLPGSLNQGLGSDNSGIFAGNMLLPSELQSKEPDNNYHGENGGIFCPNQLPSAYNNGDMQQAFSNESSQVVSAATSSAPLTTEISSLSEDSTYKVGKLSVEQRKEKIHRYLKKRNERNFSKKIKYACRKTLADSRPRVRGRFAKNDDFGEINQRHIKHEEEDYDEVQVKEEDDLMDSSDIFSHLNGVNSFKCNYQIQSWI